MELIDVHHFFDIIGSRSSKRRMRSIRRFARVATIFAENSVRYIYIPHANQKRAEYLEKSRVAKCREQTLYQLISMNAYEGECNEGAG